MIRIDLSVPRSSRGFTTVQFLLLFVGILLSVVVLAGLYLVIQWNSLSNLNSRIAELSERRDSLAVLASEVREYQEFASNYQEVIKRTGESGDQVGEMMNILQALTDKLEPGMEFLSCDIEPDTVTAYCLSPSNVKVARYVEQLNRTGLVEFLESQPQGTSRGLIRHRVLLRVR